MTIKIKIFWVFALLILLWTFVPFTASFAASSPNMLTNSAYNTDCDLTPNPEDCLRQLNQPQNTAFNPNSLPLDTRSLNMAGPLSLALKYDADLLWILGIDYVKMLTQDLGVSGKFGIGANERRANITAGYAFNANQMLKVTYEYLAQNLPYDFVSGNINTWVRQNAYGGAFQQILQAGMLHSLEISGYTIRANNKDLSPITIEQGSDYYVTDYRRIAGGLETTVEAAINLLPFKNTSLTLGAGFSQVNYDNVYEAIQSNKTLAYKAELNHIFSPKFKISTRFEKVASGTTSTVQVSHLLPKNFELALQGQYYAGQMGVPNASSVALKVSYPAPKSYSLDSSNSMQELKTWIEKPIIYAPRVLAIKDEMVERYAFGANGNQIPDQAKQVGASIDPVATQSYFTPFNDPSMQVMFTVSALQPNGKDFTKLLHLVMVSNGTNQATLQSSAPLPSADILHLVLPTTFVVTITATGTKPGMSRPMTASSGFNLTVSEKDGTPEWHGTLPAATYGQTYPAQNLNTYVTTQGSSTPDNYTFTLLEGPSWLGLSPDGQSLISTAIPTTQNAPKASTAVKISAQSLSTNQSAAHVFTVDIQNGATPVWKPLPAATYGETYTQDLREYVTTPNTSVDTYTFTANNLPKWLSLAADGHTLTGTAPGDTTSPAPCTITVTSVTTNGSTTNNFDLSIQPGAPPVWIKNTLPSTTYGSTQTYVSDNLTTYLQNGSTGHYSFQIQSQDAANVLQLQDNVLKATGTIPGDVGATYHVTVRATNLDTQGIEDETLQLTIQPGSPPVWTKNTLPNANYGATQTYISDNLKDYLQNGSSGNFSFQIQAQDQQNLLAIENNTLKATDIIPGNVGASYHITVRATNLDTQGFQDEVLTLTIQAGSPPVWTNTLLPNAVAGSTQNYASDNLLNHLQNGSSGHFSFVVETQDAPNVLQLNNNFLAANSAIPGNVGDTYHITVRATNLDTQGVQDATLTLTIEAGAPPTWIKNTLPNATYGSTENYISDDLLTYINNGNSGNIHFTIQSQDADALALDGNTLKAIKTIPGNAGDIYHITLRATDTNTQSYQDQTLTLTLQTGAAPMWIKDNLPATTYGSTQSYISDDLTSYLQNGSSGHFSFTVQSQDVSNLLQINGSTLQSTGVIPGNVGAVYHIKVRATNLDTQGVEDQTLNLTIQAGAPPEWSKNTLPPATFGSTANYVSDDLTDYLYNGSNGHYSFSIQSQDVANVLQINGNQLHATANIPGDVGSTYHVIVRATNLDTQGVEDQTLNLTIQAGAPPTWTNTLLPNAIAGSTQNYVSDSLLNHLQNGSSGHFTFVIENQDAPNVLQLNGNILEATSTIPGNVGDIYHVTVRATNLDTQGVQDATLTLTIEAGAPPTWIKNTLPNTTYGATENYVSDDLTSYIANGNSGNMHFTIQAQDESGVLTLDGNTLKSTKTIPGNSGDIYHVTLRASDTTTQNYQDQTLTLLIQPGATPIWKDFPTAAYAAEYKIDLREFITTPNVPTDTYQFTANTLPAWLKLDTDGYTLIGTPAASDVSPAPITITAVSQTTQGATQDHVNLSIQPGTPPVWKSLPAATYATEYKIDLRDYVTTPNITNDTYQFTTNSLPQWLKLEADGYTLDGTPAGTDTSPAPISLTATSQTTKGITQNADTIAIQPGTPPEWTSNTLTPATTQGAMNYMSDPLTNYLKNGSTGQYSFTIDSQDTNPGLFTLTTDGRLTASNIPDNAPAEYSVKIIAKDLSTQGVTEPHTLTITINKPNPPEWVPAGELNGKIKFDTVNIDPNDQIALNKFVVAGTEGSNLAFAFTDGKNENGNWKIVNSGGQWYLVRKTLTTNPNNIDASDVNQSLALGVNIIAENNGGNSPPATIHVTVNPDPNLTYKYISTYTSDCVGSSIKLTAIDPATTTHQCNLPLLPGSLQTLTPDALTVVGDSNLIYSQGSNSSALVDFTKINGTTPIVDFYAPNTSYYPSSNITWFLNAGSAANANVPVNVSGLPAIDVQHVQITTTPSSSNQTNSTEYDNGFDCGSRRSTFLKLSAIKNSTSAYGMNYPGLNNTGSQLIYKACTGVVTSSSAQCSNTVNLNSNGGTANTIIPDNDGVVTIVASAVCLPKNTYPTFKGNVVLNK